MKTIGMFFVVVASALFSYEKIITGNKRLRALEELFCFIERIRLEIGCYLRPISEIAAEFSSDILSKLGFFSDIQKEGVHTAYTALQAKLCFGKDINRLLDSFFSMLGRGYAEDEIKLADITLNELSKLLSRERENAPKEKKLFLTLSCGGALALIILLV